MYKSFWRKKNVCLKTFFSYLHIQPIVSSYFEFSFRLLHVRFYSWARWFSFFAPAQQLPPERARVGGWYSYFYHHCVLCVLSFLPGSFWRKELSGALAKKNVCIGSIHFNIQCLLQLQWTCVSNIWFRFEQYLLQQFGIEDRRSQLPNLFDFRINFVIGWFSANHMQGTWVGSQQALVLKSLINVNLPSAIWKSYAIHSDEMARENAEK